jgi:hypothetical protein
MTILPPAKCKTCKNEIMPTGDEWAHTPVSTAHTTEENVQYGADLDNHHDATPHDGRSIEDDVRSEKAQRLGNVKQFFSRLKR